MRRQPRWQISGLVCTLLAVATSLLRAAAADETASIRPVLFNTSFEAASLGKIEKLGDHEFRLHVKGQQDARGRNRQATWYFFRLDDVAGRELTLRFNDFTGEYNDQPDVSPAGAYYRPVISDDGEHWQHVAAAGWDAPKDEVTIVVRPRGNSLWVAHVPPYPHSRLLRLLADLDHAEHVHLEVVGKTVLGRDLHLVTITNFDRPDDAKKLVWLQARQHAWEAGTSFVMEGALRFIASDDPAARQLRDRMVFKFTPMVDPDGVVRGEVRFNANGFDVNRQWDEVDLRQKQWLQRAPEIWYVKKAIVEQHARRPIDLLLNLHDNEMNEYLETMVDAEPAQAMLHRFFDLLVARTTFDPSRPKLTLFSSRAPSAASTANVLWRQFRVPIVLMEERIGANRKLGRIYTSEDRMEFGRQVIPLMAEVVR